MKSPRSIILDRHQAAATQLDALRVRTLAQLPCPPVAPEPSGACTAIWRVVWLEMFRKPRLAWAGIGACGLLALGLNGMALATLEPLSEPRPAPMVAVQEAIRERAQLWAELRGRTVAEPLQPIATAAPERGRRRSAVTQDPLPWVA